MMRNEEVLEENHTTVEKGMFFGLDDELDVLDTKSSSSLSNLKEPAIASSSFTMQLEKERFKKSLFSQQSNPCNQKSEMKKLLQGSPELIEPSIFTADWHVVVHSSAGNMLLPDDRKGIVGTSDMAEGMTYEQLQVSLLSEGNKELSSKRRQCVILNKEFRIAPNEVNFPVLQLRLITKGSRFAY